MAAPTAEQVVAELAHAAPTVTPSVTYTAATDENHLLGRPNGYLSKSTFIDSRVSASDYSGEGSGSVDAGGSVEVFSTSTGAKKRATYIQTISAGAPILGNEYDYQDGKILLRISGYLTPDQAKALASAVEPALGGSFVLDTAS